MRQLVVQTFVTLDGVMQAPGGPGEDDSGGFTSGGWSVNYWDEQMGQVMAEATSRPFAMVLGRRTYDIMAAYWPHASEEEGAKVFNDATKYVASRNRPTLEWSNSVLLEGDAADAVAALRHRPLGAEARRQQGLHHWRRDRHVRAGRGDRHRIVRAGLSARSERPTVGPLGCAP